MQHIQGADLGRFTQMVAVVGYQAVQEMMAS